MKLAFTPQGWDDYLFWQEMDRTILARVNDLIKNMQRTPFTGIGKLEPLIGDLKGWWSRRITREHRLIDRVSGAGETQAIEIASCRFHYRR